MLENYSEALPRLYENLFTIGGINNIVLAIIVAIQILRQKYTPFPSYQRAALLSSVATLAFGVGYLLQVIYEPRFTNMDVVEKIAISYFHIGGTLFAMSYISLMREKYLNKRNWALNIMVTTIAVFVYWIPFICQLPETPWWKFTYTIFFIQMIWLTRRFIASYYLMRRELMRSSSEVFFPQLYAWPRSSTAIIVCGITCGLIYALDIDNLMVYVLLMISSYFVFYYVMRSMLRYGNLLIANEKAKKGEPTHKKRKFKESMFRYDYIVHLLVLIASVGIIMTVTDKDETGYHKDVEVLNLTKNMVWDSPVLKDEEMDKLEEIIAQTADSSYLKMALDTEDESVTMEELERVTAIVEKMPDSEYKPMLQLECLNNALATLSAEDLTGPCIHKYLERGMKIAQGKHPIPQNFFFVFWNNAMMLYSNILEADSVRQEAIRIMQICKRQNLPLGMINAHKALAYCLMDADDYLAASDEFDQAEELSDEYYPKVLGEDWKTQSNGDSELYSSYAQAKALNARCHMEANDTAWMRKHAKELERFLLTIKEMPVASSIYYALAVYYDKWGNKSDYEKTLARFKAKLEEQGYFDERTDNVSRLVKAHYYTILVRHALRNNEGDMAMEYIEKMPSFFKDTIHTYLPDALLQQHKYEEAAKRYKVTIDYYYRQLNGRNRNILHSLADGIEHESKEMQAMQHELEKQQTRALYKTVLLFFFAITIVGMGYFLFRQRQLNKQLSEAIKAAEKANHAKDIFLRNITHEFNTPLNWVYGFAQILADKERPLESEENVRMMARQIEDGSLQLMALVQNIVEVTEKLSKLDKLEDVTSVLDQEDELKVKK